MIALLLKDLLLGKKRPVMLIVFCLTWGCFSAVFAIFSGGYFEPALIFGLAYLIMTVWETGHFSMDERGNWNNYGFSLPYARRVAVGGKFLLNLCSLAASLLITLPFYTLRTSWNERNWLLLAAILGAGLIYAGVSLLLAFRFDSKAAFYLMFSFPILSVCSTSMEKNNFHVSNAVFEFLLHWLWLIGTVIYISTYFLSCKAIEKKEL